MHIMGKITISEIMLLFILLFVLPGLAFLLHKLRRYEKEFGTLPERERKKKKKRGEPTPETAAPAAAPAASAPDDKYPYKTRPFLNPSDRACLAAMREALGAEVEVFPKVALWETVESTEKEPAYRDRLSGLDFDFLVCDRKTCQPLTAVVYNPGKGKPAGPVDTLKKVCAAAGANMVCIDMAPEYDVKTLKEALGLPELEI